MKTPLVTDMDIKELIKKYPPKNSTNEEEVQIDNDSEAMELQEQRKKQLERMLKIIDGLEKENKRDREKVLYEQFISNLKNEEFMKNVEKLKELDFADGIILQTLFEYKIRDEHDQVDLANDVAKEHHSGKLDP